MGAGGGAVDEGEIAAPVAMTTIASGAGRARVGLPDFVIAGAQKAASTMIQEVLREHPQVEMPAREIYDFADPNYSPGVADAMRARFGDERASRRGFKAASYLGQPDVAPRLAADLGTVDVVLVLRDPVRRAISAWFWYMRLGRVPVLPVDVAFGQLLGPGLGGPARAHGRQILEWGLYGRHLRHWLTCFPRERIHVVLDIDLRRDADGTIRSLYDALRLDPSFVPTAHRHPVNAGVYAYHRVRWQRLRLRCVEPDDDGVRRLRRPESTAGRIANRVLVSTDRRVLSRLDRSDPPTPAPAIEHALRTYYRADTLGLQQLLGVDLSPWLSPST